LEVEMLQALLMYRPSHASSAGSVPIGQTEDPEAVRALATRLVCDAESEVTLWEGVDEVLGAMKAAEAERLRAVLEYLLGSESVSEVPLAPEQ
jgi:hypothetical protein